MAPSVNGLSRSVIQNERAARYPSGMTTNIAYRHRPPRRSRATFAALAVIAVSSCGCGDGSPDHGGAREALPPSVAAFREAFEAQRYDLLPAQVAELESAAAEAPEDPQIALTLALANLWGAAEIGRIGSDPVLEAGHAIDALAQFEHAQTLAPEDARIQGFIGSLHVRIGNRTGNAALVEQGLADIEAGAVRHPEFNEFVRLLILSRMERDSPRFAAAFEATRRTMEACRLPVTEENPSLALEHQPEGAVGPDRVCWNGPRALHNFEGLWLFVGDLYVKAGLTDLARSLYANARTFPSYATWGFQELLEQRIADADSAAARFADDDPSNDPQLIADSSVQCAVCHAR